MSETPPAAQPTPPSPPTPPSLPPVEQGAPVSAAVTGGRAIPVRWALAGAATVGIAAFAIAAFIILGQAHTRTASAAWLPADASAYVELSSDLTPDQQARVAALLKHFPGFEDQARLGQKIDESFETALRRVGLDYTTQVKPWLGSSVAMGARAPAAGASDRQPAAVVLVASTDDAAAGSFVKAVADKEAAAGATVVTESYRDVLVTTVTSKDNEHPAHTLAVVDGRFLAGQPDLVRAVIDVRRNGAASLDGRTAFRDAIGSLPADRLGSVWVDVAALAATARDELQTIAPVAGLLTFSPDSALLGSISAADDGLSVEVRGRGSIAGAALLSPSPGATAPHAGRLGGSAPASSVLFVDVHDVGTSIKTSLDAARLATPAGGTNPIDEANKSLAVLGTSVEELAGALGDAAVVVTLDQKTPRAGAVLEVKDQALAARLMKQVEALAALSGLGQVTTRDYQGVSIHRFAPAQTSLPGGLAPAYALAGDALVIATDESLVETVIDARRGVTPLTGDADFSTVGERVGTDGMVSAYVDVAALFEAFAPATVGPEERALLAPLHAVGISVHAPGEHEWLGSSRLFVLVR